MVGRRPVAGPARVGQRCGCPWCSATIATAVSFLLGVPLAWVLARAQHPRRGVCAHFTVQQCSRRWGRRQALSLALGRQGMLGPWLFEAFGITIPFTTTAVVLAETFVAHAVPGDQRRGALRAADARFEDVAATLGADRRTVHRVTLPLVAPGVAAGAVLCWARALGEFGATITFASNSRYDADVPLAVYLALQRDPEAAIVLSLVLLAVSLATLLLLRDPWLGRSRKRHSLDRLPPGRLPPTWRIHVADGEVLAVLGPNGAWAPRPGSARSPDYRRPTAGSVVLDGTTVWTTPTPGTCSPTGGSTSGTVTSARRTVRPRIRERASTQASGTPSTIETPVASVALTAARAAAPDRPRAGSATGRASDHGARTRSPTRGSTRKATPSAAGTSSGSGTPTLPVDAELILSSSTRGSRRAQRLLTGVGEHELARTPGRPGVGRGRQRADRVLVDRLLGLGERDALDVGSRRRHVGGVDERGVHLAELHLGQRGSDVLLLGVRHGGDAGRPEHLLRGRAARDVRGADGQGEVGVREVGQPGHLSPGSPSGRRSRGRSR